MHGHFAARRNESGGQGICRLARRRSGVLILSTFAGAAQELTDALLVNPYDVQQVADAILRALNMPEDRKQERMRRMRHNVREHNVYRWAANLLSDLTEIRIDVPDRVESPLAGEVASLGTHG